MSSQKDFPTSYLVTFFFLNLLLSSYFIDTQLKWNTTSRVLPVLAVVHDGTWHIDKYHHLTGDKSYVNGHYYSDKPPLPSLLTIPFYGILKWMGFTTDDETTLSEKTSNARKPAYIIGGIISGSIPFAFLVLLIFLFAVKQKTSFSPVLLTMLPLYGSFLFIYSGTFFSHLLSGVLLLIAYIFLKYRQKYMLAGLFSGLAFLCEYTIGIVFPVWAFLIWLNAKSYKKPVLFMAGVLPAVIFLLAYNYLITGSPFQTLYRYLSNDDFAVQTGANYGFLHPQPDAIWQLLFSDYRGLFFYVPCFILLIWVLIKHWRPSLTGLAKNYLFVFSCCFFLAVSSFHAWWGGWCYGPRYLIPMAVLLAFEGLRFLSTHSFPKTFFWMCVGIGLLVTWMSKSTIFYSMQEEIKHPFNEVVFPLFFQNNFHNDNMLTMLFGTSSQIATYIWLAMFIGIIVLLDFKLRKLKNNKFSKQEF
ncbi:MAG: hypothetical protein COA57_12805 [Flavobacteriales bacterium]|nr:hypothetical protein [Bacteroidales bacterium AH-315-I05]PCJ82837.1 MAG: hypothetical protein COA57_12805 [Flavobacteriales bacterium]